MQTTMDLSGLWEVRLGDGAPATVHLPGTLEENGLGEPETPALESRLTRRPAADPGSRARPAAPAYGGRAAGPHPAGDAEHPLPV